MLCFLNKLLHCRKQLHNRFAGIQLQRWAMQLGYPPLVLLPAALVVTTSVIRGCPVKKCAADTAAHGVVVQRIAKACALAHLQAPHAGSVVQPQKNDVRKQRH